MNDSNGPVRGLIYLSAVDRRREAMTDPVVTTEPTADVPEPVRAAAWTWGALAATLTTVIGVAAAVGFLSAEQADVLNQVVGLVSTAIVPVGSIIVLLTGLVSGLASAHVTAAVARKKVTPVKQVQR